MSMVCGLDLHRGQITFDALRGGVRRGVAGPCAGRRTGPGSVAGWPTSWRPGPEAGRWRWRWRAAPGGAMWSRRSPRRASWPMWPSRPTLRRRGAARSTPRPTAATPGCCASCSQSGDLPESWIPPEAVLEWRERVRLYKTLLDQRTNVDPAHPRRAVPARREPARRPDRLPPNPGLADRRRGVS